MTSLAGASDLQSAASHTNSLDFIIDQKLAQVWTELPVRVVACTASGALAVAGTVNVVPLVNQVDGDGGNPTSHGTIYGVPYLRLQGGGNALILDPAVNDIGMAFFCHRDISAVKATKQQANPGSFRRFDPADAFYVGGTLNGQPTTTLRMDSGGNIFLSTPGTLSINAATISSSGSWTHTGALMNNGHNISNTHEHVGVQSGTSNTGTVV